MRRMQIVQKYFSPSIPTCFNFFLVGINSSDNLGNSKSHRDFIWCGEMVLGYMHCSIIGVLGGHLMTGIKIKTHVSICSIKSFLLSCANEYFHQSHRSCCCFIYELLMNDFSNFLLVRKRLSFLKR